MAMRSLSGGSMDFLQAPMGLPSPAYDVQPHSVAEPPADEWIECEATIPHEPGRSIGLIVLPDLCIEDVDAGSALAAAGVGPGMVLVGVDGTRVTCDSHALSLVNGAPGPSLKLSILIKKRDAGGLLGVTRPPARQPVQRTYLPPPDSPRAGGCAPHSKTASAAVPRMFAAMSQPLPAASTEYRNEEVDQRVERILAATAQRLSLERQRSGVREGTPSGGPPPQAQPMLAVPLPATPQSSVGPSSGYSPPRAVSVQPPPRRGVGLSPLDEPVWAPPVASGSPEISPPRRRLGASGGAESSLLQRQPRQRSVSIGSQHRCCGNPGSAFCQNTGLRHVTTVSQMPLPTAHAAAWSRLM